jgi:hypothetical protein
VVPGCSQFVPAWLRQSTGMLFCHPACGAMDFGWECFLGPHAMNRTVRFTRFHNLALTSPAEREPVDRHTKIFRDAWKELTTSQPDRVP